MTTSLIEYNYLKLPKRIVKGSTTILYQYDASGRKLRETIGTNVTDYVGNLIYKNNSLYQLSHDEGRIINGVYEYNIKDHLGNLRVAFKDSSGVAKITQANHTGVWGEELPTLSYQNTPKISKFTYSTYEKENDFEIGLLDAHARLFDNIVPHFLQIDPLAEKYFDLTTYSYVFNNPIRYSDPSGLAPSTDNKGADGLTNEQWVNTSNPVNHGTLSTNGLYDQYTSVFLVENARKERESRIKGFSYPKGEWDFHAVRDVP